MLLTRLWLLLGIFPSPKVSSTTPSSFSVTICSKSSNCMPGKIFRTPMGTCFSSVTENLFSCFGIIKA